MADLFDKCIDLTFYDSSYNYIGEIKCPPIGPKPEIKISGKMLCNWATIDSKVVVTNVSRELNVDAIFYIKADAYYRGSLELPMHKTFIYKVLYADQSKAPPDRQVEFNCLVESFSPDIFGKKIEVNYLNIITGEPSRVTFHQLLKDFIINYNRAVSEISPKLADDLSIYTEPIYKTGTEKYSTLQFDVGVERMTIYEYINKLNRIVTRSEPYNAQSKAKRSYKPLHIYLDNKQLIVDLNPTTNKKELKVPNTIKLAYVNSVYRNGNICHVKCLFDPRITPSSVISISTFNMGGKRSLRQLIPISSDEVEFYPVAGIDYEFGTIEGSSMSMFGAI